jgi:HEPN domain-containing protein
MADNRSDFQKLAKLRIKEAKVLLDGGLYAGSYYLAGYAVECALKACIAKQTRRYQFPPDRKSVDNIYTHNLETLMKSANLWSTLLQDMRANPTLTKYWVSVKAWSEKNRYEWNVAEPTARDLYSAITDKTDGVLSWLRKHW